MNLITTKDLVDIFAALRCKEWYGRGGYSTVPHTYKPARFIPHVYKPGGFMEGGGYTKIAGVAYDWGDACNHAYPSQRGSVETDRSAIANFLANMQVGEEIIRHHVWSCEIISIEKWTLVSPDEWRYECQDV